tara:strand:- start:529 stop:729 length:201 start_codon:yes stop_codon:yes gene_type:complete
MKNSSLSKKYLQIISKIEKIRSKNNKTWMNILKLSFKHAPKDAAKLMSEIYKYDSQISKLVKKLSK